MGFDVTFFFFFMEATVFKKSSVLCSAHTDSRAAKGPPCRLSGGLFKCRSATQGWVAPTSNSSGLQITLKRPGQGYRFLWALVSWLYLWLDSQIYKNEPVHLFEAKWNTDEEIFIHFMKEMFANAIISLNSESKAHCHQCQSMNRYTLCLAS